jgi:hypothetical protein
MRRADWRDINALFELARQARETRLAEWRRREAEIEDGLARISAAGAEGTTEDEVMRRAGADLRWQAWCDARRTALLGQLAQVRYRRAAAEEDLRKAARRTIATAAVLRTEEKAAARLRDSRAEREGRD